MTCVEVFESEITGKELQIAVDTNFPNFECEQHSISAFSPGTVDLAEKLAFILIDPLHYDEVEDKVTPTAFQELFNRDLSTLRVSHARRGEAQAVCDTLVERGKERTPPQCRLVREVCVADVQTLRAAVINSVRVFGAYDTALEAIPAHASIFTIAQAHSDKRLRKDVRALLYTAFLSQRMPFQDFSDQLQD